MEENGHRTRPWLAYYDEGVPASIDYPEVALDRLLADAAAEHPDHPAIIFGGRVGGRILDQALTYQQLDRSVTQLAAGLQGLGVKPGDRVAIMMPNCPQFVISFYGILRAGGVAVPCNFLYSAEEIEHQLSDAGAEVLIVLSAFYQKVHSVRAQTPLRHVIVTNIKEYFPTLLRLLFTVAKEKKEGHYTELAPGEDDHWFQSLLSEARGRALTPVERGPADTGCLLYTGGTTGVPKGAQLTHRNLVSNAVAGLAWSHSQEATDITIGALPLFHSYGMTSVMNMGIAGALTMVLIPNPRDVLHIMGSIAKHRATFYPAVPTMYVAINNHPQVKEFDLSSVNVCLSGAAPLPGEVQEKFQDLTGSKLVEAYGLTETTPATHVNPINRNKIGFIGVPWPDTDARIVDAETGDEELPVGDIGELVIQGPQVMKGYWQQPTETANVLREHPGLGPGLWLHTGDIARMDEEGYFQIVDRKKDMIICGGFNVYPRDVEEVLFQHPAVAEAAVIGVPDEYRGETVKAFVVLREGMSATAEEIIAFCGEHLAKYKVPSSIAFRDELPKSAVGKVLRRELA
ncbi:MAG: long-chain fatty acid--CoA ligase [Anaerolineae bacterium]|nr:long-chain fatty acid--CoA ligase [Anaerolineae bacterium]